MKRAACWVAAGALLAVGCLRDAVEPGGVARFSLSPVFQTGTGGVVDFDRLRVTLTRLGQSTPAVETTIALAAAAESVVVDLRVQINGQSEDFVLLAVLLDALGQEIFRAGPDVVTLRVGGSPVPVVATFRYTGTGAAAAAVRISPPWSDTTLFFGDSLVLVAEALDSAGQPIAGTPIGWTSLDPARLVVRRTDSGLVVAASQRGAVPVEAALLTGQTDTGTVTVQPHPAALGVVAGDGQAGVVGTVLAESLVVRVTGADGLGVRGVPVAFAAAPDAGIVAPALVATDPSGRAAASWTLGLLAGNQVASATGAGLSPVTFTATVSPGPAMQLAYLVQPSDGQVGAVITPPLEVAVQDQFGNTVTSWASPVALRFGKNPGGAILGGTTIKDPVNGVATFDDLTVDQPGNGYTLLATSDTLPPRESAPFTMTLPAGVVFAGDSSGGLSSGVFRVNPDGSNRVRLDPRGEAGNVHPRSSPDRRRVAFTSGAQAGATNQLFVVARTGDTVAALVSDTSARRPRWSPDGVRLAFECGDGFSTRQDVCVIPDVTGAIIDLARIGDGTGKTFVTDFDPDKVDGAGAFAWNPLNPRVLVVVRDSLTDKAEPISRLFLVVYDGTAFQPLSDPLFDPQTLLPLEVVSTLDWSADGSTIVFAAQDPLTFDPNTPTGQRLYAIGRDGTGLRQLTKGPALDERPVWSPDSRQVLFIRDNSCSVDYWIVDVASGPETQVSAEGWCDFTSSVLGHDWSPDSKALVLVGAETPGTTRNFLIYRVPAGTTATTYAKDRVLIGRGVDVGGFVTDVQPSWRP